MAKSLAVVAAVQHMVGLSNLVVVVTQVSYDSVEAEVAAAGTAVVAVDVSGPCNAVPILN